MRPSPGWGEILVNNAGIGPATANRFYLDQPQSFEYLAEDLVRQYFEVKRLRL